MHVKAAPLGQSPHGLGIEEKMQSRGKQASASPFSAGGTVVMGGEDGSRSENQGRDDQPLFQMLW